LNEAGAGKTANPEWASGFSIRVGIAHPDREVALPMQHAPDVKVIATHKVEDQCWRRQISAVFGSH